MAKINQIIATIPQSYEVVRSAIAGILATEIKHQRELLNAVIATPPTGYTPTAEILALECLPDTIYEERITLPNVAEMSPYVYVNVMFSGRKPSNMVVDSGQAGMAVFVVEVWAKSKASTNFPNGEKSAIRLQRALGTISHILHSKEYKTFGIDPKLGIFGGRNATEIQIGQPEYGAESSEHQIQGSLIIPVKLNDKTPDETYTGIIDGIDYSLKADNGTVIYWSTTF